MAQERDHAATVISQEGDRLLVEHGGRRIAAAMRGFPAGFRLAPGARVILRDESDGVAARPLVRTVEADLASPALHATARLEVGAQTLEVQQTTIVDRSAAPSAGPRRHVLWVIEHGDIEPGQVVATRPLR
jgi:hypothetical protein